MESQEGRLEEIARNFTIYGELNFHKYAEMIDNVTDSQIADVVGRVTQGKPSLLVTGGAINLVPTVTDVQNLLH